MPVIKRYPNRKLYNTEAKQYVTLEGIADLIRQGQEIQVVDYASGEDLTAVTLTQIISELEKRRSGFLPQAVLTGLVRSGGETLAALRRTLASPLDLLYHVDEEIERRIEALVAAGDLPADEGRRLRDLLVAEGRRSRSAVSPTEEELAERLRERGVVTRQDLQSLIDQLDVLTARLDATAAPDRSGPSG
jgi:polyhydroxyalkanoate synthesis repressor PhaR